MSNAPQPPGLTPVWIASAAELPPVGSTISAAAATHDLQRQIDRRDRPRRTDGRIERAGTAWHRGAMVGEVRVLERQSTRAAQTPGGYLRFVGLSDEGLTERLQRICDVVGHRGARRPLRDLGLSTLELEITLGDEADHRDERARGRD